MVAGRDGSFLRATMKDGSKRSLLVVLPSSAHTKKEKKRIATVSSSCPKEDYRRPPLFFLSSSVTGQPSVVHYPCRHCHPPVVAVPPRLLLHPPTTIAPLLLIAHALCRYLIAITHIAAPSSLASSLALLFHRNHLLLVPHPLLLQALPAIALYLLCFLPYRIRFQLAISLLSLPLSLASSYALLFLPCCNPRHPLPLYPLLPMAFPPHQPCAAPSLALLSRCSTRLPPLPSSFSSQPSIAPSPSAGAVASTSRRCLLFNHSLNHLYHRRYSLSSLSLPTATIAAPPAAHPSSTTPYLAPLAASPCWSSHPSLPQPSLLSPAPCFLCCYHCRPPLQRP
ncbi:hypothetical protein B296_00024286 [Ensete ventricosum]|uniref:Uncharacterized protein n=1 Tax=Ensete ventricosum TaxID=4639 RepID=A0A426YYD2_ENSVE|nr:hypothetical protein B296_00024286 [Ensete ventricosum]